MHEQTCGTDVVAVLLAGGRSQRMLGRDKAFVPLAGRPLLEHCLARLTPQVATIVISANGDPASYPTDYPLLPDGNDDHAGPLAGILKALQWAQQTQASTHVLSVAVDTPFFPVTLAKRLCDIAETESGRPVLAMSGGRLHPTFGLWPVALLDSLEAYLAAGDRKMMLWAEQQGALSVTFEPFVGHGRSVDPFFNINTAEDLALAEGLLAEIGKEEGNV
ncbi:molybdenum cofactor guanylyltransferase MobA [Cohaesibacter haloalkalitolerans]|uniref:molybdenum cofactor guanylyltransferase MobA n=1 Tax=Cohaesibacter haloalkalitolerans TaxID=1162980 RepID=UPI000E656665|nr:molybdenum cofactor guanylyltransferase MobA [Cohaesibacter haloalkalitolerans]